MSITNKLFTIAIQEFTKSSKYMNACFWKYIKNCLTSKAWDTFYHKNALVTKNSSQELRLIYHDSSLSASCICEKFFRR